MKMKNKKCINNKSMKIIPKSIENVIHKILIHFAITYFWFKIFCFHFYYLLSRGYERVANGRHHDVLTFRSSLRASTSLAYARFASA